MLLIVVIVTVIVLPFAFDLRCVRLREVSSPLFDLATPNHPIRKDFSK